MHNLRISNANEYVLEKPLLPLTNTSFDRKNNAIIYAHGPKPGQDFIELRRRHVSHLRGLDQVNGHDDDAQLIASWDSPCSLPDLTCDRILSLHYFGHNDTTCLVLEGGDLVLVRETPGLHQEKIEIVGSIDVGISAAAWSPVEDLLAVVTREGSLILMSQQLAPVVEVTMQEADLNASRHVSVGWGKKETQFQGKRAKAMRDPTMPETIDQGIPSNTEDGQVTISWRGDGAFLAVNSVKASSRRIIRVYSRDGVLDSVSEPVDRMEAALSWRPHGNIIATTKRTTSEGKAPSLEVIFFERNGLRHGQFDLRLTSEEVSSIGRKILLDWNSDSTILAVQLTDRVQFWTMSNYHYHLKTEIFFEDPTSFEWHRSFPSRCCVSNAHRALSFDLRTEVSRASTVPPFDYGLVGVIDGKKLKLTPFKHVATPPPMAFVEIEADTNITACAFNQNGQKLAFIAHSHLYLGTWSMDNTNANRPALRHSQKIVTERLPLSALEDSPFCELAFQADNTLFLLIPARGNQRLLAARGWKLTWNSDDPLKMESSLERVHVPDNGTKLIVDGVTQDVWILSNTRLYPLSGKQELAASPDAEEVVTFWSGNCATIDYKRQSAYHGSLIVDGQVLSDDCTSFAATNAHILFTTQKHLLKFVHLEDVPLDVVRDDAGEDERLRVVERGAKIITVVPSIYAVVLQMPRGNLEIIYPRVLVLGGIRKHIQTLNFRAAFVDCQKHQIDPNFLYDLNPTLFMSNIGQFVDNMKKPARLDEFISKLKDEDTTQKLYYDTSIATQRGSVTATGLARSSESLTPPNKVNKICDALIALLENKSSIYLQNIITAHVTKRPPDLSAALSLISQLHRTHSDEADLAISHLVFLTDANRLYDTALSLYDLELTLLVAQNAQRDPREYLPFLQSLNTLPILRRKYTIDNHLRNHISALTHLHALSVHEEVEAYTVKHSLYTHAESLYAHDPERLSQILHLHASHLTTQNAHVAAATIYESLHDYTSAYPLYALAHAWREALTCASLVTPPLPPEKLTSLARSLATTMADEDRDYRAAATIHSEYLDDHVAAARALCRGSYFADAMRVLAHPSRSELREQIGSIIDPMLGEKFGEIVELMADCKAQLAAQVPRIEELRVKKAQDPLAFFGGDAADPGVGEGDIPDNISLAATDASTLGGQSLFTRYGGGGGSQASTKFAGTVASNMSRKTSRTKRREERKRARGKKGSVYEEEYLVASVGRLVERVNATFGEVGRLVSGLRRRGKREWAEQVGVLMGTMVKECEDAVQRVWPETEKEAERAQFEKDGMGRPPGADGVLYDAQMEMVEGGSMREKPVVKAWKEG